MPDSTNPILQAAQVLFLPGDVVELRVPKAGRQKTISGYYQDLGRLARDAASLERSGFPGVYWTVNPCLRDRLARADHRLKPFATTTTADHDIACRRWLPVDFDPRRAAGISSSEEEHAAAIALARHVAATLAGEGWPAPVVADSGNGAHLLYRVELENDAAATTLLRDVLLGLGSRFNSDQVEVDRTTFNASRIFKVYGTWARKGDHTQERPHRLSRLLETPETPVAVPVELLRSAAALAPRQASPAGGRRASPSGRPFDVEEFLGKYGLRYRAPVAYDGGRKWVLEHCPFNPQHEAPDSMVFEGADGRLGFKCLHNSCADYHWTDLRDRFEPGYRQRYAGPGRVPPPDAPADVRDGDAELPVGAADVEAAVAEAIGRDDLVGCMALLPAIASLPEHLRVLVKTKLRVKFGRAFSPRDYDQALRTLTDQRDEPPPQLPDEGGPDEGAPDLTGYPLTDSGNGERMVALHGRDIRFCVEFDKWLVWDGRRWLVDEAGLVTQRAKAMCRLLHRQAAAQPDSGMRDVLQAHARDSESQGMIMAMLKRAATEPGIAVAAAQLDRHPYILNCLNGMLDVRTGQLLPPDRECLITKLCHHKYVAAAACPRFLAFLEWAMGENGDGEPRGSVAHLVGFLQKAFGYSLTGDVSEKAAFICYGRRGNNGKTTLLTLFTTILQEYSTQLDINTLMTAKITDNNMRADLAKLRGARLVITSEVDEQQKLSERLLKYLTAGMGKITACRKYENPVEFDATHKIWMDANYRPVVRGSDDAIWSRLKAVPFEERMEQDDPRMDKGLKDKLLGEAEGVLAWAVRGAMRWHEQRNLGEPPEVKEANVAWRESDDPLKEFLEDCCETGLAADGFWVKSSQLSAVYDAWCKNNRERFPLGRAQFGERLEIKGFGRNRSRRDENGVQMRTWEGLRIKAGVTLPQEGQGRLTGETVSF